MGEIRNMGERLFKDYESLRAAFIKEFPESYAHEFEERDIFTGLVARVMKKQLSMSYIQDRKFREGCKPV